MIAPQTPSLDSASPSRAPAAGAFWPVFYGAFVAALGGLLFGFDTAVISGTTEALKAEYGLDSNSLGFTVSVALIGTVIGSMAVGRPADRWGRKATLRILAIFYFVSAIGCAIAPNWSFLLGARFIGGLAIGGASVVAPMYIAEISPPLWRGRLVAISQLNIVLGILLSYLSNYLIVTYVHHWIVWRLMLGVVAVPSVLFFFLVFALKESPRWLVFVGRTQDARRVLHSLKEPNVEAELIEISRSMEGHRNGGKEALFQARYRRPILLAMAIALFNQLSGINAVMYYAPRIFQMAGAAQDSAMLQSIIIGGVLLLFTVAAMFVIDRIGRRKLIIAGSIGMIVSLALVAFELRGSAASRNGTFVLLGLVGFIACFAFSSGAVIWVFISEIFPNSVRAKGQALGSFTHWFTAAVVSWTFPVVAERSGTWAFGFFGLMMALQLIFAWQIMPETMGGKLEDIEARLTKNP